MISVIPIKWKDETTGEEKEYHVGFQVDVRTVLLPIFISYKHRTDDSVCAQLHRALSQDPVVDEPIKPVREVTHDPLDPAIKSSGPGDERWAET